MATLDGNMVECIRLTQHNVVLALIESANWEANWEMFATSVGISRASIVQRRHLSLIGAYNIYFLTYCLIEEWISRVGRTEGMYERLEGSLRSLKCEDAAIGVNRAVSETSASSISTTNKPLPSDVVVSRSRIAIHQSIENVAPHSSIGCQTDHIEFKIETRDIKYPNTTDLANGVVKEPTSPPTKPNNSSTINGKDDEAVTEEDSLINCSAIARVGSIVEPTDAPTTPRTNQPGSFRIQSKGEPGTGRHCVPRSLLILVLLVLAGSIVVHVSLWYSGKPVKVLETINATTTAEPTTTKTVITIPHCLSCKSYLTTNVTIGPCKETAAEVAKALSTEQPTTIQFRGNLTIVTSDRKENETAVSISFLRRIELHSTTSQAIQSVAEFLDKWTNSNRVEEFLIECTQITPEIVKSLDKLHLKSALPYSRKLLLCWDGEDGCKMFDKSEEFGQITREGLPMQRPACSAEQ